MDSRIVFWKKLGTGRGQIDLVIVEDLECVIQDCFDDTDLPPNLNKIQEHYTQNRMNAGNLAICFGYVPAHSTSYIRISGLYPMAPLFI
jgi:hypothetical protein